MKALMVQGASSWAGKSLITTALARHFARAGIRVTPFKAQNMSNNARVVGGGEIGTAQWLQALAAGVEPDVRMNPVLVKPEADDRSQVIVLGKPDHELSRCAWPDRPVHLWNAIRESLESLLAEFDLVLLEGAGSPAEINLRQCDLANMRVAQLAEAPVLLVCDIDRGGAFAHLYGTWSLLPRPERDLIRGFVLNKFRGDEGLLTPGPGHLETLTGVPTLGVIPWLHHTLPDEDGAADPSPADEGAPVVAIVRYPTASNLDEFKPLEAVARVRWATTPDDLVDADLVVLPGSKYVSGDLEWLGRRGLPDALRRHRGRLLGICGGLQMLGQRIEDESGIGLLPIATVFARDKTYRRAPVTFAECAPPWNVLSGITVDGYEIRHGASEPTAPVTVVLPDGLGFQKENVLGIYLHGLFEDTEAIAALLETQGRWTLDATFDRLADDVEAHLDMRAVHELVGIS